MNYEWFFISLSEVFFISFVRTKETKQRKSAGSRSEAKILTLFLKKMNSRFFKTLKQHFFLNEKAQEFLHASPLHAGIL